MTRRRVENRDRSLGYPRFVKPVFTKDSKPLGKRKRSLGHLRIVTSDLPKEVHLRCSTTKDERGRGSLVVKIMDSWLECHGFESSAAENPSCRGNRRTLNLLRLKRLSVGVEVRREGQLVRRPRHLTVVHAAI
ncbi:hypothetical protein TNCV_5030081 [Trichonephila clavipes]|nr:hypothetical protein TNCV_5030081 [Trichonephila clavipes]